VRETASGGVMVAAALADAEDRADVEAPFNIERSSRVLLLHGQAGFVADAAEAGRILHEGRWP
jgi:phage terminase large subunit-like protein